MAIGLHNIPEGLATATLFISQNIPFKKTLIFCAIAAAPQAIFAAPAFLFVEIFKNCLPLAVGFAAGSMLWIVFFDLLPDTFENIKSKKAAFALTASVCLFEFFS